MKYFAIAMALVAVIGCKRKLSGTDIENELKNAMRQHLYKAIKYDSAKTQFDVQTVTYFEDKNSFECEFKVRVTAHNYDTTGIMRATVSKDFSKVIRKS